MKRKRRSQQGDSAQEGPDEGAVFAPSGARGGESGDTLSPDEVRQLLEDAAAEGGPGGAAERPRPMGGAGDTIRMPSLPLREPAPQSPPASDPSAGARPMRPKPKPRPATSRVADLPRRSYSARHRFAFIWYVLGFFGLIFRVVLVTVIVMGLAGAAGYYAVRMYVKTPETSVPNVRGMKVDAALAAVAQAKLGLVEERSESSGMVAPGEILGQRPLPGARVKTGSSVRVVVSSGRSAFVVPDVVNETQENATNKIKGARLEVGNVTVYPSDKAPKGVVIGQNPEAGKGLDEVKKVDLLVSGGPAS
jgi:hypothetical protein